MKKIISIAITVIMVASLLSVAMIGTSAAGEAASIGSTKYATLAEAFAAVKNGETIKIEKDLPEENTKIKVNYDDATSAAKEDVLSFTVDGNGKKITTVFPETAGSEEGYLNFYNSKVTVKNLSFEFSGGKTANGKLGACAVDIYAKSEITLDNVTINCKHGDGILCETSTLTLNNSTIITDEADEADQTHNVITANGSATITINGGAYKSLYSFTKNPRALIRTNSGKAENEVVITINGGTFETKSGRFYYENGGSGTSKVTINDGTFTFGDVNDSFQQKGAQSEIIINGGTFDKGEGSAKKIVSQNSGNATAKFTINGGTFNAPNGIICESAYKGVITVTGGTFKSSSADDIAFIASKIAAPSTGAKSNSDKTLTVTDPTATTAVVTTEAAPVVTTDKKSTDSTGDTSMIALIAVCGVVAFVGASAIVMRKKEN